MGLRFAVAAAGLLAGAGLTVAGSAPAGAQDNRVPGAAACSTLSGLKLDRVEIVSAGPQAANEPVAGALLPDYFGGGKLQPIAGLPAFCRIVARAHPEKGSDIKFEVWMPLAGWNGRFLATGNGGFAGPLEYMGMGEALKSGYATASTDTGHEGDGQQSTWAKGNPAKIRDYGWRGVHVMTDNAKRLAAAFYGRPADKSYFSSCSNGGRQALMEASRFPNDYDGIVAGAPAVPFTKLIMSMIWTQQVQSAPGAALRQGQAKFLQEETLKQCDAADGVSDGLIDNPQMCKIDLAKLSCGTFDSAQCLAPAQKTALEAMQAGPHNSKGKLVAFPYLLSGAESGRPLAQLGWEGWIIPGGKTPPSHALFPMGILNDFVAKPFAQPASFDWDRDPAKLTATAGREIDVQPNLSRYFARGGKLIVWHGWSDAAIPPQNAIEFNQAMLRISGKKAADSSRLFLIPGMQHCFGGTGASSFGGLYAPKPGAAPEGNVLAAMEHWVEHGTAPESLIGSMNINPMAAPSARDKQRLHCAWPNRAVLTPGADVDRAASYSCKPPQT